MLTGEGHPDKRQGFFFHPEGQRLTIRRSRWRSRRPGSRQVHIMSITSSTRREFLTTASAAAAAAILPGAARGAELSPQPARWPIGCHTASLHVVSRQPGRQSGLRPRCRQGRRVRVRRHDWGRRRRRAQRRSRRDRPELQRRRRGAAAATRGGDRRTEEEARRARPEVEHRVPLDGPEGVHGCGRHRQRAPGDCKRADARPEVRA